MRFGFEHENRQKHLKRLPHTGQDYKSLSPGLKFAAFDMMERHHSGLTPGKPSASSPQTTSVPGAGSAVTASKTGEQPATRTAGQKPVVPQSLSKPLSRLLLAPKLIRQAIASGREMLTGIYASFQPETLQLLEKSRLSAPKRDTLEGISQALARHGYSQPEHLIRVLLLQALTALPAPLPPTVQEHWQPAQDEPGGDESGPTSMVLFIRTQTLGLFTVTLSLDAHLRLFVDICHTPDAAQVVPVIGRRFKAALASDGFPSVQCLFQEQENIRQSTLPDTDESGPASKPSVSASLEAGSIALIVAARRLTKIILNLDRH